MQDIRYKGNAAEQRAASGERRACALRTDAAASGRDDETTVSISNIQLNCSYYTMQ